MKFYSYYIQHEDGTSETGFVEAESEGRAANIVAAGANDSGFMIWLECLTGTA